MVHVLQLAFALVFALAGFLEARRFERQYGRTPWGWNPWAWAVVLGLSFVIGIILLGIAERVGRSKRRAFSPTDQVGTMPRW